MCFVTVVTECTCLLHLPENSSIEERNCAKYLLFATPDPLSALLHLALYLERVTQRDYLALWNLLASGQLESQESTYSPSFPPEGSPPGASLDRGIGFLSDSPHNSFLCPDSGNCSLPCSFRPKGSNQCSNMTCPRVFPYSLSLY